MRPWRLAGRRRPSPARRGQLPPRHQDPGGRHVADRAEGVGRGIEQLHGRGRLDHVRVAAQHQHLPVRQLHRVMTQPVHFRYAPDGREAVGYRVVDLRAAQPVAAQHKHPAVVQCDCAVVEARHRRIRASRERPGRGVVDLRARDVDRRRSRSLRHQPPRDQHPPVRQQRGDVPAARRAHGTGERELTSRFREDLRRRQRLDDAVAAAREQHPPARTTPSRRPHSARHCNYGL